MQNKTDPRPQQDQDLSPEALDQISGGFNPQPEPPPSGLDWRSSVQPIDQSILYNSKLFSR